MKVTKLTCMLFIMGAMVMASSCKKQETTESINVISAQWQTEDNSRIYIDFAEQHVFWDEGDQINVYNLDYANGLNSVCNVFTNRTGGGFGVDHANFSGPSVGRLKDSYFIFYPTRIAQHGDGIPFDVDNRETFTIPTQQDLNTYINEEGMQRYTVDRNAIVQAYKGTSLRNFQLSNIFGVARFYIKGSENLAIDHAELIDNEYNLTGTVSLKLPAVSVDSLNKLMGFYAGGDATNFAQYFESYVINELGYYTNYPNHTKMLTLNCRINNEALPLLGAENYRSIFFGVRPGALNQGFKLKVYFDDGQAVYIDDWYNVNDPNECIKPAVIKAYYPTKIVRQNNYPNTWGTWAEVEAM